MKKTKSADTRKLVEKINKFTPNQGNKSTAKKSTSKFTKVPQLPSPGGDKHAGTTDHTSMKEFQKMIQFLKNKGRANLGKRGGKGSVSSKIKGDGKKSKGRP